VHLVEPTAAVPHNNRLSEAGEESKAELAVLTTLSELLRANLPDLATALEALVRMDAVSGTPGSRQNGCWEGHPGHTLDPHVELCCHNTIRCLLPLPLLSWHALAPHAGNPCGGSLPELLLRDTGNAESHSLFATRCLQITARAR